LATFNGRKSTFDARGKGGDAAASTARKFAVGGLSKSWSAAAALRGRCIASPEGRSDIMAFGPAGRAGSDERAGRGASGWRSGAGGVAR
jgi:hypothetical protein